MTDIAKILKDAPKGLELYSPVYGKINLRKYSHNVFPIVCTDIEDTDRFFTSSGKFRDDFDSECILFPSKEHKSWDNWQEVLFQVGDVVINQNKEMFIIIKKYDNTFTLQNSVLAISNVVINNYRYATPEERDQFFKELNNNGYKWNADTKQIEKIEQQYTPKYKVGDIIKYENLLCQITNIENKTYELNYYTIDYKCKNFIDIIDLESNLATDQELIDTGIKEKPFTIDDFKPFDKVLVRDTKDEEWKCDLFSHAGKYIINCVSTTWKQCIPYNDETKHLLGTTDNCPDKYKTW